MADLDILNYPGSKLGSLTSAAPPVLKPTPKTSATSDLMAKIGAMPTPGGYIGPKETLASEQELLAQKGQATEDLAKADIGVEKAKKEEEANKLDIDAQSKRELVESIRSLPIKAQLDEKREQFKNAAFVPTKDTVQDIAGLFSLINVIGMAIGGGGKQNAQLAMHAMNGMAEGYQKGRSDLYRKQQIEFDKNFKAMQAAVQTLEKEYSEAVELEKTDKEAGRIARQVALAKQNSPVLKALEDRAGVARTLDVIKDLAKSKDTAVDKFNSLKKIEEDKLAKQRAEDAAERRHKETLAQARELAAIKAGVGGALPKDKETNNEHRFRFTAMENLGDVLKDLQDPKIRRLIGPENQYVPDILLNLQKDYPQLAQKLARFQSEEFKLGGKNLTAGEQRILGPIYNWRGLTVGALEDNLKEANRALNREQMILESRYPGLQEMTERYRGTVGGESTPTTSTEKPQPTQADRDWIKAHPEDRAKFVTHFGVEP
jgi:hypothetical protein